MKRTRSYYLGRFRTIDQLLFMVTIFVAGMGLCMVLWSLDLFDNRLFRFCWEMWIMASWTLMRSAAKRILNAIAKRRGDDVPFSRDNIIGRGICGSAGRMRVTLNTDMGTVQKGLAIFDEQKQLPAIRLGAALFVELRQNA